MEKMKLMQNLINDMKALTNTLEKITQLENAKDDNYKEDNKEEKYSRFLYKLDQTNGITEKEREQFIGIYKMMNIFTKDILFLISIFNNDHFIICFILFSI